MYMCYRNVVIFHCHVSFHGVFLRAILMDPKDFQQSRAGEHRKCRGGQQIASWFVVSWGVPKMVVPNNHGFSY